MSANPATRRETRHLALVVAENAQREQFLTLEGTCQHQGDIMVNRVVGDLSDTETAYGKCGCGAWVVRTTWLGRRGPECYETRLMTPREVDVLIGAPMPKETEFDQIRRADWLADFQEAHGL